VFLCEDCRKEKDWPESVGRYLGRCEICGKTTAYFTRFSLSTFRNGGTVTADMLKEGRRWVFVRILVTTISDPHAEELVGKMMRGEETMSQYWNVDKVEPA
jgi:hypothetical protein